VLKKERMMRFLLEKRCSRVSDKKNIETRCKVDLIVKIDMTQDIYCKNGHITLTSIKKHFLEVRTGGICSRLGRVSWRFRFSSKVP